MVENNFKWLINDIDSSLVLKVFSNNNDILEEYGVFNINDLLETPCEELEISTGNINDLTNLLTLGVVRFINVSNSKDVLEIPFRRLYLLYKNANILGLDNKNKLISFNELDSFSVIDGNVRDDLLVCSFVVDKTTIELDELMKISYEYGNYGMQEKMDALNKITIINHRRVVNDEKEKKHWNRYLVLT